LPDECLYGSISRGNLKKQPALFIIEFTKFIK